MLAKTEIDRTWHVLTTEPQMERKAASHLVARGYKVYLPEEPVWVRRGVRRRKIQVFKPMFRGYLFIHIGEFDDWRTPTTIMGIHRYLQLDGRYAVVSEEAMRRIYAVEEELQKPKEFRGPSSIFSPGEKIRIDDGPFTGLNANIETLDDAERVTILLNILGRESRLNIRADQLEKL